MRVCLLLLASFLPAGPVFAETVQIIRDEFGVPHIFATTPEGAAYAAGYSQAEDRSSALLRNLNIAAPEAAPLRTIVEAYAAGINRFLEEHGKPAAIRPEHVNAFARRAFMTIHGSGDLAIAPARTGNDGAIAVLDPYMDWSGDGRPYEMRLYISQGDIAISGVAPAGVPFPLVGHSRFAAVGWSGSKDEAGAGVLEQAWAIMTARDRDSLERALGMGQIPGAALVALATGEVFDTSRSGRGSSYVMRARASQQADAMVRQLIASQTTWSPGRVADISFSTDVYKAETWQARLAKVAPQLPFVRMLTGWNRRAEVESIPALAFYLFKMELGREAEMIEPPDSLSDGRIRAALDRAKDRLELKMPFAANWGTLFRSTREGARESYPVGGGTVTEAGMETPRAIAFERRGSSNFGVRGQVATQIVQLSGSKATSVSVLTPGQSDDGASKHFDDQARELFGKGLTKPTYFGDRRELERHAVSKKELTF